MKKEQFSYFLKLLIAIQIKSIYSYPFEDKEIDVRIALTLGRELNELLQKRLHIQQSKEFVVYGSFLFCKESLKDLKISYY